MPAMTPRTSTYPFRVRYSETDQMGHVFYARALDWFEWGRTELLRETGIPYAEVESRGVFLPVVEAHARFLGRATYDDLLEITTTAFLSGRARLRCEAKVVNAAAGESVVEGYTVHAFTDAGGRPIRPPKWFTDALV